MERIYFLETSRDNTFWTPVVAGMYKDALKIVEDLRDKDNLPIRAFEEAINLAKRIRVENYGIEESVGISFRVNIVVSSVIN